MATSANNINSVSLTGFIAVEAQVKEFEKSAVARFPLSISRTETNGDTQVRKSALISCECWNKDYFALFTKVSSSKQLGSSNLMNGPMKPAQSTTASSSW